MSHDALGPQFGPEAMSKFPAEDVKPGMLIISGSRLSPVHEVRHHAPGEHPHSPIRNELPATEVVTQHGSRWSGRGMYQHMVFWGHPGQEVTPKPLRENAGKARMLGGNESMN